MDSGDISVVVMGERQATAACPVTSILGLGRGALNSNHVHSTVPDLQFSPCCAGFLA